MKLIQLTFLVFFLTPSLNAQCILEKLDCHSIEASIEEKSLVHANDYTYTLEQEIVEDVWKSIAKSKSSSRKIIFSSLTRGKSYRVTCMLDNQLKNSLTTKLRSHNAEIKKDTDGFISNVVSLDNCPENFFDKSKSLKKEQQNTLVKIFPNPASDVLIVSNLQGKINVLKFYNLQGQLILEKTMYSKSAEIDISLFQRGIYFIRIEEDKTLVSNQKITIL